MKEKLLHTFARMPREPIWHLKIIISICALILACIQPAKSFASGGTGPYYKSALPLADTSIHGRITSPSGEPLTGVSVHVKGTPLGAVTDDKGQFRLSVPAGAVLQLSYIGYKNLEINV